MSPALISARRGGVVYDLLDKHITTEGEIEERRVFLRGTRDGFELILDGIKKPTEYSHHQEVILDDGRVIQAVADLELSHQDARRSNARREQEGPPRGPNCV